jgi:2-polyprenyl-3-methyl-5-hydroxy-6-metoxy-1,4-benzoquinol methylase
VSARGLAARDTEVREFMDDPECDADRLSRTYRDFKLVNRLVSGWAKVYRRRIRPLLSPVRTTSLLDIGSGGGDVTRAIASWAAQDGLRLDVTGIDPDPRAHEFARDRPHRSVHFRCASSAELLAEGARFDLVISNHLLHHLGQAETTQLLRESRQLSRRLVIHNDIERGRLAYAAYGVATLPVARRSFIHPDGLRSIRRSYRAHELAAAAGPGWRVERQFPSRLLLLGESGAGPGAGGWLELGAGSGSEHGTPR